MPNWGQNVSPSGRLLDGERKKLVYILENVFQSFSAFNKSRQPFRPLHIRRLKYQRILVLAYIFASFPLHLVRDPPPPPWVTLPPKLLPADFAADERLAAPTPAHKPVVLAP